MGITIEDYVKERVKEHVGCENIATANESGFSRLQQMANEIAAIAGVKPPDVFVADYDEYAAYRRNTLLFSYRYNTDILEHAIIFDRVDLNIKSEESLRSALGHEIAHMLQPEWPLQMPVKEYAKLAIKFGEKMVFGGVIATGAAAIGSIATGAMTANELSSSPIILAPAAMMALGALGNGTAIALAVAYTRGVLWQQEYDADIKSAELTGGYYSMRKCLEGIRDIQIIEKKKQQDRDGLLVGEEESLPKKIRRLTGYEGIKSWAFLAYPSLSERISRLEKLEKGEPPTDRER